jgi:hypothetical protein
LEECAASNFITGVGYECSKLYRQVAREVHGRWQGDGTQFRPVGTAQRNVRIKSSPVKVHKICHRKDMEDRQEENRGGREDWYW